MSKDARLFNIIETRAVIKVILPCKGNAPNDTDVILKETLREHVSSSDTVKSWVAQFKLVDFSTCDAPRPGRPKTVTNPYIIYQIQELNLEGRQLDFG
jgi:hypothetical protein